MDDDEDILQSARFVIQGLDALKLEHGKILETIAHSSDSTPAERVEEQVDLLRQSIDRIELGIGEAQAMMQLNNYLQHLEAEKHKLLVQVRRLCQENAWLRDELGSTQKKLHECEQTNASYAVEIEHLKFLRDVKLFDADGDGSVRSFDSNPTQANGHDLVNELFPMDENDSEPDVGVDTRQTGLRNGDSYADLLILPASTSNGTCSQMPDYQIPDRLKTLHHLVIQYASQGRYEVAVPLCRQALEDLESTCGHQHPDVATMLNILALVYRDQANYNEASKLLNEALAIRESTLGSDHPTVAATLNNLAVLYGKRNEFGEAEALCKRALAIREKCLGPQHPDVAKQLNNLALLCQNQGKYDEVESFYKRAIAVYTESLGPYDLNVDKTMSNLASACLKQQKYADAEQVYTDILVRIVARTSRSSNATGSSRLVQVDTALLTSTLKNLSSLYRKRGRYSAADTLDRCASRSADDPRAIVQAYNLVIEINRSS